MSLGVTWPRVVRAPTPYFCSSWGQALLILVWAKRHGPGRIRTTTLREVLLQCRPGDP